MSNSNVVFCKEHHKFAVRMLRRIAKGDMSGINVDSGICNNLVHLVRTKFSRPVNFRYYILDYINVREWPKFSGNREFPVPSTIPTMSPFIMYNKIASSYCISMYEGEYGKLRKEFAAWCADEIEKKYLLTEENLK